MCTTLAMPTQRKPTRAADGAGPRATHAPRADGRARDALSPARRHKVRRIRAAIAAGEYENELKLHVTVERLLDVLN